MPVKPKYEVPSMEEIEKIPWNGYKVVSTFSGGGGSCLGYRMAGYHVIWANEFVEEAQRTYRANHKDTFLNTSDIRMVTPENILKEAGLQVGELDLFDGSPPCCAFSMCGKREKGWGKKNNYSDSKVQRADDLFFEYTRLLKGLQPKVFIAENVNGLVLGKAKGYFKEILKALKDCGYVAEARLVCSEYLGVPQTRHRIIFQGVRNDISEKYGLVPCYPKPLWYTYTLLDAFKNLPESNDEEAKKLIKECENQAWCRVLKKMPKNPPKKVSGSKYINGSYFNLSRESLNNPCSTVCQRSGCISASGNSHPLEDRKFTISELKRIMSVPDDFVLTGNYEQQWERLGRMVPPIMMKNISLTVKEEILDKIQ